MGRHIHLCAIAVSLGALTSISTAEARTRCPGVAKRVAGNALVRVYETREGTVRACWRESGRTTQLAKRSEKFRLGELRGPDVAYSVFENGAYVYLSVRRMDVRARRLTVDVAATSLQAGESFGGTGGAKVDTLRLTRTGLAWVAHNPRLPDQPWEVFYVGGGTLRRDPARVAVAPTYEPGSFAVGRSHLYWSAVDGTPQRAGY